MSLKRAGCLVNIHPQLNSFVICLYSFTTFPSIQLPFGLIEQKSATPPLLVLALSWGHIDLMGPICQTSAIYILQACFSPGWDTFRAFMVSSSAVLHSSPQHRAPLAGFQLMVPGSDQLFPGVLVQCTNKPACLPLMTLNFSLHSLMLHQFFW